MHASVGFDVALNFNEQFSASVRMWPLLKYVTDECFAPAQDQGHYHNTSSMLLPPQQSRFKSSIVCQHSSNSH